MSSQIQIKEKRTATGKYGLNGHEEDMSTESKIAITYIQKLKSSSLSKSCPNYAGSATQKRQTRNINNWNNSNNSDNGWSFCRKLNALKERICLKNEMNHTWRERKHSFVQLEREIKREKNWWNNYDQMWRNYQQKAYMERRQQRQPTELWWRDAHEKTLIKSWPKMKKNHMRKKTSNQ